MLDILSVILSFISILQNSKKKTDLKAKVIGIKKALDKVEILFNLLSDAKDTHDEFEKFDAAAMPSIKKIIEGKKLTKEELETEASIFLKITEKLLKNLDKDELSMIVSKEYIPRKVPDFIRKNIQNLNKIIPRYIDIVNAFNRNLKQIKNLAKKRNFGDEFERCAVLMQSSTQEVKATADDIILNISPIISFTHFEIKNTLEEF